MSCPAQLTPEIWGEGIYHVVYDRVESGDNIDEEE